MEIEWKEIDGHPNYLISNDGRIKRKKTNGKPGTGNYSREEREIKQRKNNRGYWIADLWDEGKRTQMLVHRAVAGAFIPNPLLLPVVNHKDEDKNNNNVNNLEWCTQKYNMNYGTCPERIGASNSKPVIQISKDGSVTKRFKSIIQAERETGISNGNISDVLHGRNLSAGGYLWEYEK